MVSIQVVDKLHAALFYAETQFVPKIMHQNLALDLWPMYYSKFNFKGLSVVGEQN